MEGTRNKNILYGTEEIYSVLCGDLYIGKESEKEWIYAYVELIHFAVHLKLTQHCKSSIPQCENSWAGTHPASITAVTQATAVTMLDS